MVAADRAAARPAEAARPAPATSRARRGPARGPAVIADPAVRILLDADACPVKEEAYRVAFRHGAGVWVVSNSRLRVPEHPLVTRVVVGDGFDAADDWIAEQAGADAIVVTADILLADRCLKAGAAVIAPTGKPFTAASIGSAIATRAIMADLRAGGEQLGGPAPFARTDRSRFLSALDAAVVKVARAAQRRLHP